MVVAQKMKHRMNREIAYLPLQGMGILFTLFQGPFQGNHNVPQKQRIPVKILIPKIIVPVEVSLGKPGLIVNHGEGQDVGDRIQIPGIPIDFPDGLIVHQENTDFGLILYPLVQ
jgi:hypothetical protein